MSKPLEIPKDWEWTGDVARHFDTHVRESLPWYDLATGVVAHIAKAYVPRGGLVLDVGCSTGNIGRTLCPLLDARGATLVGIDSSREMVEAYDGPGRAVIADVTDWDVDLIGRRPDLVVCFLSLMFVPVAARPQVVSNLVVHTRPGGAVVVFDKMVPRPGYVGTVSTRLALAAKMDAGVSPADVVAKELSISGVQRPLEEVELTGFVEVFRFGDFGGWVRET